MLSTIQVYIMGPEEFAKIQEKDISLGNELDLDEEFIADVYSIILAVISKKLSDYPTNLKDDLIYIRSNPPASTLVDITKISIFEKQILLDLKSQLAREIMEIQPKGLEGGKLEEEDQEEDEEEDEEETNFKKRKKKHSGKNFEKQKKKKKNPKKYPRK
jgi:hypothetical protein